MRRPFDWIFLKCKMEWNIIAIIYYVPTICLEPISHTSTHFISQLPDEVGTIVRFTAVESEALGYGGWFKHPFYAFIYSF